MAEIFKIERKELIFISIFLKTSTLLVILCSYVLISGCIDFSKDKCKENIKLIGRACNSYAYEHKGKYPQNLNVLIQKGYLKESETPKCPKDNCEYIFISKYVKKYKTNYFIMKCQKHLLLYDSKVGLIDPALANMLDDNMMINYGMGLTEGKVHDKIFLTDEELKKLGFKK